MVEKPEEWKWSSYGATASTKRVPDYLMVDWMLGLFGSKQTEAQKRYRQFVREGIHQGSPWEELQGQVLLGEADHLRIHYTTVSKAIAGFEKK